jgi:citrate synthase
VLWQGYVRFVLLFLAARWRRWRRTCSCARSPIVAPCCHGCQSPSFSPRRSAKQTITVIDNRTGKSFELPITHDTIKASDLGKVKGDGFSGLRSYDPGYFNTASVTSRISFIDGDKGILEYRGYPIEQLAEKSSFIEVSYLLIYGELPSKQQLDYFSGRIMRHTFIHEDLATQMKAFRYDAHPMGMLISTLSSMSTVHPEANPALAGSNVYKTWPMRNKQIHRVLGTVPTIAAFSYRHRIGRCAYGLMQFTPSS